MAFRHIHIKAEPKEFIPPIIEGFDVPVTEQQKVQRPPNIPAIPVPVPDEKAPDNEEMEYIYIDLREIPNPPPPSEPKPSETIFIRYDKPPSPIGGFEAIQKNLIYPEIAQRIGVKGKVTLKILVSTEGLIIATEIIESSGHPALDNAAVAALKSVKWHPALQRDKPVKVWVRIPFMFDLH